MSRPPKSKAFTPGGPDLERFRARGLKGLIARLIRGDRAVSPEARRWIDTLNSDGPHRPLMGVLRACDRLQDPRNRDPERDRAELRGLIEFQRVLLAASEEVLALTEPTTTEQLIS